MEHVKVSVIVPVYKVERYLEKCLRSLVLQNLKELEVIAVNDGSPDRCPAILRQWAKRYPKRIFVFDKENGGLSDARNFGLERARGDYVAFLDSDDWADPDLYHTLWKKAEETGADVVACPVQYEFEDHRPSFEVSCGIPAFCQGKKLREAFTRFYPAVWNKLYRRELLEKSGCRFKKGAYFEDVEFSHRLFPYIRSAASVPFASVHYLQREGAITSKADLRLFDYLSNFRSVCDWFREKGFWEDWNEELEYAARRYLLATFLKRAGALEDADFERALSESLSFLKENFPRAKKSRYYFKNGLKGIYLLCFTPALARKMRKRK